MSLAFSLMATANDMTIVWGGTLALFLAKLKRKPYEVTASIRLNYHCL